MFLKEYERQETAEAKMMKDLDRFEMILQAFEYEKGMKKQFRCEFFIKAVNLMVFYVS